MVLLENGVPAWPTPANDDGTGTTGTPIDVAFLQSLRDAINGLLHSTTNPTETQKGITDEVVLARGDAGSLNARLSVVVDANSEFVGMGYANAIDAPWSFLGARNHWADSLFYLWPDGDAAAPYNWTLGGGTGAVARCGSGLSELTPPADSTRLKWGKNAVKITKSSGAAVTLTRTVISAANFPAALLLGKKVTVGVRCKATVANAASIVVNDGVLTTRGGDLGNGTYHSGLNTENMLYLTHTFSPTATKLEIILEVAQNTLAYFGCGVIVFGGVTTNAGLQQIHIPPDWFSEEVEWHVVRSKENGNTSIANTKDAFREPIDFANGALLFSTRLKCGTAPVTTAIIVRPTKNGGTFPYSVNPSIAAAGTTGNRAPEGTYANRCFKQGDFATWDVTQIGTGTVGADVNVVMVFMVFRSGLEALEI